MYITTCNLIVRRASLRTEAFISLAKPVAGEAIMASYASASADWDKSAMPFGSPRASCNASNIASRNIVHGIALSQISPSFIGCNAASSSLGQTLNKDKFFGTLVSRVNDDLQNFWWVDSQLTIAQVRQFAMTTRAYAVKKCFGNLQCIAMA